MHSAGMGASCRSRWAQSTRCWHSLLLHVQQRFLRLPTVSSTSQPVTSQFHLRRALQVGSRRPASKPATSTTRFRSAICWAHLEEDATAGYSRNPERWVTRDENQLSPFVKHSSPAHSCTFFHTEPSCLPVAEASVSVDSVDVHEEDGHFQEKGDIEPETLRAAPSIRASRAAEDELLPRVMIVGRPNVGKSALFNRLTRRREALVYNTPDGHVTRDVREGIAKLAGLRFKILDTAGLETFTENESILSRTAGITATALRKCQIALFLVDGRAGLQPQDADVGKWLRKTAPHVRVVIALNKAEGIHNDPTGRLVAALAETYQLGFGEPTPISAESGEGLGDLYETLRPLLEEAQDEFRKRLPGVVLETEEAEDDTDAKGMPMQLAIAGRPNVGKSTLVNALLREERVLTGPEPGLTRDSVSSQFEYDGRKVRLVDTAGWMQRVQVKEGPSALSAMHARKGVMMAHVVALVLDGEEVANTRSSMRHAEAALARWVVQEGRGLVVVVNKMDLLAGKENAKLRGDVMKAVPAEIQTILPQVSGVPVVFVSALESKGSAAIMRNAFQCYEKWCTRLTTAQLNRWLRKVMSRHPKNTSGAGYGAKVKFMTQVKARPPTFVVFVSGAGELEETDLRFLASALREDFGLDGIPLRILQRSTKK